MRCKLRLTGCPLWLIAPERFLETSPMVARRIRLLGMGELSYSTCLTFRSLLSGLPHRDSWWSAGFYGSSRRTALAKPGSTRLVYEELWGLCTRFQRQFPSLQLGEPSTWPTPWTAQRLFFVAHWIRMAGAVNLLWLK
jgi:hypothetical protein